MQTNSQTQKTVFISTLQTPAYQPVPPQSNLVRAPGPQLDQSENTVKRVTRINKSVNRKAPSNLRERSKLQHSVRVSKIIKRSSRKITTNQGLEVKSAIVGNPEFGEKAPTALKKQVLNVIRKSVKKVVTQPKRMGTQDFKKMNEIVQTRAGNERVSKISMNQCNLVQSKDLPVALYDDLIKRAEIKDRFSCHQGSIRESLQPDDQLEFSNLVKNSIQLEPCDFEESDVRASSVKKSVFSNHASHRKPEQRGRGARLSRSPLKAFDVPSGNDADAQGSFRHSSKLVLGRAVPSRDFSASPHARNSTYSVDRSQASMRSRNSSCYKIVKREVGASAKMSQKNVGRLSHDLRAFKVKAKPLDDNLDVLGSGNFVNLEEMSDSMLKTAPVMNNVQPSKKERNQFFFSPSKSDREIIGRRRGDAIGDLKSRSNSYKKQSAPAHFTTLEGKSRSVFTEKPFLTHQVDEGEPCSQLFNVSPEKLGASGSPPGFEAGYKTALPWTLSKEEDPELLLKDLESGIEELKKLKKRTASHTPTRNQRMIYRQILDNVCPQKKAKKRFKSRVDTGIRRKKKRSAHTPNLKQNYSRQLTETRPGRGARGAKRPTRKGRLADKENPRGTGLGKYCSMKYAALQLKNQQNALENILQKCHQKFQQIDKNIENLRDGEVKYQAPTKKSSVLSTRNSKYYSKFVKDQNTNSKKPSFLSKTKKFWNPRKKSKVSRATASTMKMNRIFRELNRAIKQGRDADKNYSRRRLV